MFSNYQSNKTEKGKRIEEGEKNRAILGQPGAAAQQTDQEPPQHFSPLSLTGGPCLSSPTSHSFSPLTSAPMTPTSPHSPVQQRPSETIYKTSSLPSLLSFFPNAS
jgi:hypothetical protein